MNVKTNSSNNQTPYLIKELKIDNLYVTIYKMDGSHELLPVIPNLSIKNISDESGFPVHQIEKAVYNEMLKSIFNIFDIKHLFQDTLNPLKIIPGF